MSFELSRRQNADLYGPTTGDAVRLGDTDLFAEIERDLTHHGEEAVFGGGVEEALLVAKQSIEGGRLNTGRRRHGAGGQCRRPA